MTEEIVDIDFEISVTNTSSDADIPEVSRHADIDDVEESNDEENQLIVFRNQSSRT